MKKIIVAWNFVFIFFIFSQSNGYSQSCTDWIDYTEEGGVSFSVAVDDQGNTYHACSFDSTIQVGTYQINLPAGYLNGFYLAKYDADGVISWLSFFYSTGILNLFTPQISYGSDAVWMGGAFIEGLYAEDNSIIQLSPGSYCHFILKFNPADGSLSDQAFFETNSNVFAYSSIFGLYATDDGNVYTTGPFRDSLTIGTYVFNSPGGRSVFVARLNSDLDVLWAIRSTTSTSQSNFYNRGYSIKTDKDQNVIVGGLVDENITFGTTTFSCLGINGNPFLLKLDQNGNCLWIRGGIGYPVFSNVYAIESDGDGNIYCAGAMDSTLIFDGVTLDPDFGVLYFNKYSPSGVLQWAKQYGIPPDTSFNVQVITDLNHDGDQKIWATGWSGGTQFGSQVLPKGGVFVVTFGLDGIPYEAFEMQGLGSSYESKLDAGNNLYIEGSFSSDSIILPWTVIAFGDTAGGDFVLKLCDEALGVEEMSLANLWKVYPNPSVQFLYVERNKNVTDLPFELIVSDISGRKFFKSMQPFYYAPLKIDIAKWPDGIYMVQVISCGETIYHEKIIVQH